jgi:Protein of unknown function (DUF1553)/Protein of unknown function (DUF1549)/Planctomycete cytochrome C
LNQKFSIYNLALILMSKYTIIGAMVIAAVVVAGSVWIDNRQTPNGSVVDFNTQIRPIFNANCLRCHGGVRRQGDMSLLFREEAISKAKSGKRCIVPFHPEQSELIARLKTTDPDEAMPLNAERLKPSQIQLIEKWIAEGAHWETHWAYLPPKPQVAPFVWSFWPKNDIDKFVYHQMRTQDLKPNDEADKAVLLRRVTLDLTGLAPTEAEYEAFENGDESYEEAVERLLKSPHFGERWASMWLDLARYGDSQGYQKDRRRDIWKYRDWVVEAFNDDMPFNTFTIQQLGGDLLPKPTTNQLIATAFHRNSNTNDEGGTDDEEFRVVAVLDRVNTTFEVWQSTTIGCVQCHTHPYDPFRHKEYYQLMAFFNNTLDTDRSDDYPVLPLWYKNKFRARQALLALLKQSPDTASAIRKESLAKLKKIKPVELPIMQELGPDSSRKSYVFVRGNWMVHGEEVRPQTPKTAGLMPASLTKNRLGLAQWLVSDKNPLTARVMVNRFWEQLFGRGLVETLEDFGTQGAKPSHPALLDYLALRFRNEQGWSIKKMLKDIVLSATYRQDSKINSKSDTYNQFLAHGPRVRLTAEQVRDQSLTASGLLNRTMLGPSVMPPQPEGVWHTIRNVMRWKSDTTANRYRRALYTFWRKSSPYPSFVSFDAPSREFCVSRRVRTNTPLQALITLNDPVYLETAQALAHKMLQKKPNDSEDALKYGYKLLVGQKPSAKTLSLLEDYYEKSLKYYEENPAQISKFLTLKTLKPSPQLAAMALTTNVLLNLDEVVTKE